MVRRAASISVLAQELQQERLASVGRLIGAVDQDRVEARSRRVRDLAHQLQRDHGTGDDKLSLVLRSILSRAGLEGVRIQVAAGRIDGLGVYTSFSDAITNLLDLSGLVGRADRETAVGRQQLALDALLRHDEAISAAGAALFVEPRRQITVRVVGLASRSLGVEDREEAAFLRVATPEAADLYRRVSQGPASTRLLDYLDSLTGDPTPIRTTVDVGLLPQVELLTSLSRTVGTEVATRTVEQANRSAARDRRLAAIGVLVAALLCLGATVLSVLITRSISRPLRRLTVSADEVADVAQWELVRVADSDDPEEAVPQLRPVRVGTADELGELAQAFNRVQQVATSLVERQLVSRRNVATMFGNVGRRTQNLVGRQLAMIDSLERNEQDPVLLDRLYRLDHVSTRLRRNANSLVVLSGADDQLISGEPLTVADTIRSALGEIEGFQRVRLGRVDSALLTPNVTPDVILLLAELLENGTSFSPPHTEVEVEARVSAVGGVTVRVVDHGLGMTVEQLAAENGRLVSRERLDLAPTDVLGLFVVGRLARRHGIEVVLAPTPGTGVTAEVRVPARHVVRSAESPVSPAVVSDLPAGAPDKEPEHAPDEPASQTTTAGRVGGHSWWASADPTDPPSSELTASSEAAADAVRSAAGAVGLVRRVRDHDDSRPPASDHDRINALPRSHDPVGIDETWDLIEYFAREVRKTLVQLDAIAAPTLTPTELFVGRGGRQRDSSPRVVVGSERPAAAPASEPAPEPTPRASDELSALTRRVPGAHLPADARAGKPDAVPPSPAADATEEAAAARSLLEEFEAGVQRALRDSDRGPASTDQQDAR